MEVTRKDANQPSDDATAVNGCDNTQDPKQPHDELASKLEQQIRTIATCFRLKEPKCGFSPSEWLVLSALANATEQGLKPLAQQVSISTSTTSKIVRKLLMLRLIEWKRSDTERRGYALCITVHGIKTYRQSRRSAIRNTAACFSSLTVEQLEQVTSLLDLCLPTGKFSY